MSRCIRCETISVNLISDGRYLDAAIEHGLDLPLSKIRVAPLQSSFNRG